MKIEKLVMMANAIAAFFEAEPDREIAIDGVSSHLRRFWDPRMRRQLVESVDAGQCEGLNALVRAALSERREQIWPSATASG